MSEQTTWDQAVKPYMTGDDNIKPLGLAADEVSRVIKQFIAVGSFELECHIRAVEGQVPDLAILFSGPDSALLSENDGALIDALEGLAIAIRACNHPELVSCSISPPTIDPIK